MKNDIRLSGSQIYLRSLIPLDASEEYCAWLNDPEVNKHLETHEATIEDLKKYITEKNANPDILFLGIFAKDSPPHLLGQCTKCGAGRPCPNRCGGKHIGNIKLEPIEWEKKCGTMGIMIGDKNYWGRGIATEANKILAKHAFGTLGLLEINLGVKKENKAAIRAYEKVGFTIAPDDARTKPGSIRMILKK